VEIILPLIAAASIILLAYFIFGITGFGSSIVSVPLLVQLYPLQTVVPLIVVLDLCASFYQGKKSFKQASFKELYWLAPFTLVGLIIGVTLLLDAPKSPLLITLGIFAGLNGVRILVGRNSTVDKTISQFWSIPFGVSGGIFTALFATGGPIYASYLALRIHDAVRLRATMTAIIFSLVFLRLALMIITGLLLKADVALLALVLIPFMAIGVWAGTRAHIGIQLSTLKLIYGLILVLSGCGLLFREVF
jgi:uncharacterized protein